MILVSIMFDLIHGLFGIVAAVFTLLNVLKLYRDKKVRGISIIFMFYLCSFNVWNIFYLFSLQQTLGAVSGLFVLAANIIWFGQMIYYLRKECK